MSAKRDKGNSDDKKSPSSGDGAKPTKHGGDQGIKAPKRNNPKPKK